MSKISQTYANNSIQKMFIDTLSKDGVICNFYSKYYLEDETYKGGTGDRLAFKNFNDKIIRYHNILKVLTGERRSNIYEAIPAIDFIHSENNSFLYTYRFDTDRNKIDPSVIYPIESYENEKALDLIDEEDPYTINRALMGLPAAEHFYNTTSIISDNYNLQVTFPGKDNSFIYKGVKIPDIIMNEKVISGTRKTSLMVYRVNTAVSVYFNPIDNTMFSNIATSVATIDGEKYMVDSEKNIILNVDCGWVDHPEVKQYISFEGDIIVNENPMAMKSAGSHFLSLQSGDLLVAIPSTTYSIDTNKILVFKAHTSEINYREENRDAIEGYLSDADGCFYRDKDLTSKFTPNSSDVYLDINSKSKKDIKYYQYDASVKSFFELDKSQLIPLDSTGKTFSIKVLESPYSCYILYVDGFNSGLSNYTSFTEIVPGSELDSIIADRSVLDKLSKYATIESCYYGNASGLLNGYFCEPCEYEDGVTDRVVTKWKFIDETQKANEKGVYIDVGSKYYPGHLLGRGHFIDAPLKLTEHDFLEDNGKVYWSQCGIDAGIPESLTPPVAINGSLEKDYVYDDRNERKITGITGKASLIYKKLVNDDIIDKIFQSSELPYDEWKNFDSRLLTNVITKFDYSDAKLTSSEAISCVGVANPYANGRPAGSQMEFKGKFYKDNELIGYKELLDYINIFERSIQGNTLVLNSRTNSNILISNGKTKNKKVLGCEGDEQWWSHDNKFSDNCELLKNKYNAAIAATYYTHYKSNGSTVSERKFPYVNTITPLNMMRRKYISEALLAKLGNQINRFLIAGASIILGGLSGLAGGWLAAATSATALGPIGWVVGAIIAVVGIIISLFSRSNLSNPWTYSKREQLDDAVLLFPEYNRYFPENVLLISGKDLKLEPYTTDTNNPTRGICTFLYPGDPKSLVEDDREPRALMFRVSQVKKILFSKINQVRIISDECPGGFTSSYNGSTIAEDCYIYILSPLSVHFDNKIDIRDWDDKAMDLKKYETDNSLLAASYPNDYFPVTIKEATDGTHHFEIDGNHRLTDFDKLWASIIIPGLPDFTNYDDLANTTKDGYSLEPIAKMIYGVKGAIDINDSAVSKTSGNINSIIKRILNSILSDWPLSEGTDDSLTIKDIPSILEGILSFGNEIQNFSDSEFEIDAKGKKVVVSPQSMVSFIDRLHNSQIVNKKKYKVIIPTPSELKSKEGLKITNDEASRILKNDFSDFTSILKRRLQGTGSVKGIQIVTEDTQESEYIIRPSFQTLNNELKGLTETDALFQISNCNALDKYLGNNTVAFLNIGNEINDGTVVHHLTSALSSNIDVFYSGVVDIIKETTNEVLNLKSTQLLDKNLGILKNKYSLYYTASSINKAFKIDEMHNLFIDESLLEINTSTTESRNALLKVKNGDSYGFIVSWVIAIFGYNKYKDYSLDNFISKFVTNTSEDYFNIKKRFNAVVKSDLDSYLKNYNSSISSIFATDEKVSNYLTNGDNVYQADDNLFVYYSGDNNYCWKAILPKIEAVISGDVVSEFEYKATTVESKGLFEKIEDRFDISENLLEGLAQFVKTSLEGTNPNNISNEDYYVKFVTGEDTVPIGRENSLYYKRYKMLNNRMNRLQGNLWLASTYLRNSKVFEDIKNFSEQYVESYQKFVDVMPIKSMESLTYMPVQLASATTIPLDGKFYSDKELEALRALINNNCTLTCTACSVKDQCPFYNENEVIKMYCTGVETIDIWVKDNELDLIADDEDAVIMNAESFNRSVMKTMHYPYSEIKEKVLSDETESASKNSVFYNVNDISNIKENLKRTYGTDYTSYVKDDLGWLVNSRYGSVSRNSIKEMLDVTDPDNPYSRVMDDIPPYNFMYDAVFVKASGISGTYESLEAGFDPDADSYIQYTSSNHRYPFTFEKGFKNNRKLYSGTAKIKIPISLKIIATASNDDDIYLISDDTTDPSGSNITPVIYLGKAGQIQWAFDLTDDGIEGGAQSSDDTKLYAADVAQWCMNYLKGNCYEYPIGGEKNSTYTTAYDNFRDRDQYWMEKVYKDINGSWQEFNGRPRTLSGYSETLMNTENINESQVISGKPVVANYIDFIRKVSIRMYDSQSGKWLIPWVNDNLPPLDVSKYNLEEQREIQRSVLPLMKTNLRLAVVKSGK